MKARNAQYNERGDIDVELLMGEQWVPFTASPNDTEASGRNIFDQLASDNPAAYVAPDPEPQPTAIELFDAAQAALRAAVNDERNRRLYLPFDFNGTLFDRDPVSIARISGAGILALGAMMNGAQLGNYRWHSGATDFGWISYDGSIVTMDAQTVFAFGQAAAKRETLIIFAADALKKTSPIPIDFAADKYWP